MWLRQDIVYSGDQAYTGAHDAWLRQIGRQQSTHLLRTTFESGYDAVLGVQARRDRLYTAINQPATDSDFTAVVWQLGCLRA